MIDCDSLVTPGTAPKISKRPTDGTAGFDDDHDGKKKAKKESKKHLERLDDLQEILYAERQQSLLVILQAMDAGGKDSTIKHIFGGTNPQGVKVTSFGVPTELERRHDFLWRHHAACPADGMIGIHNRSHYEAVLVERVLGLVPPKVWRRRYDQINDFEAMLASEGTTILKFFLHVGKAEQKERFQDRIDRPDKHWKFNPDDLKTRDRWDDYQWAFEDALKRTSTKVAPWYVIPADHKWARNWIVSDVLVRTLEKMDPKYPPPVADIGQYVVE